MIKEQILSLGFMFILKTKASNTYNTSEYEELYTINWQEKIDNPRPCQSRTDNFRTFTTIPDETYISRHNQESEQILLDSFANDDYIDAQTRGSTLNCDTKQLLDGKNPTFCTLCLNIYMCEHIKERVDIVQGKKNSNSNKNSVNEFNVTDILDKNTKDVEKLFPYQFINKPEENHRNTEQVRQTINPQTVENFFPMQNNSELKHTDMCINYPFNLKNLPPSTNMLGSYNLGYLEGQKPFMRLMQQDSIQETCGQNMKMFLESKNIQEQNVNLENFGDSKNNSINLYVIDSCAKTDTHGNLNIKRRFETEENFGRKTHKKYKRNDMRKNSFVSNQSEEQTISEINETINPNIFTAKYNFLKQPHHNKIYFCPYKTFSVRDSRKFKKDYNNFDEYINHVAEDISIDLIHLINSFNEKNKIRFYKSQNSFINTLCATREFHDFLKIYFQDSMSPPTSFDILEFYDRYFIYKIWIFDNFKLMKIEAESKYRENYIKYIDYFKKNSITNEKSLLEFYIEIFDSENYNFLFKIIPYFSLIHRIKDITGKYFVVSSIKLIQLIICRIEAFRFDYFNRNMIEDKDINELYLDQRFNETILIICILFRKLMAFCNVSEDLKLVFEVYNFIYFLRSQYYQYFTSSKIFKSIAYDNPFENKILGYKMDNLGNLIDLDFTKKIKDLDIYKIIRSKINDDLSKSIPLDVAIKPFKRRIRKKLK